MAKTVSRLLIPLIVAAQAFCAAAAPRPDARPGGRAELLLELFAGPTVGMDRALRGGRAGLAVGIASGQLSAALRAGASYDASLGCFLAEAGLSLGLGGGARLLVGGEIPLGSPELRLGGAARALRPARWPGLFALSVPIARIAPGGGRRPELSAEAELSYSAYRIDEGAAPAAGAPEAAGIAGFSAGFRAWIGLRLAFRPKRP